MTGKGLRKKRKELKLTQEEAAKLLGISTRTLISYEQGGVIPESRSEILQNFIEGNISGSNINVKDNTGGIAGNNIINISLPEEGTQKIIKPDGTTIIESLSPIDNSSQSKGVEVEYKRQLQELQSTIDMQKKLIESYEGTIKAQQHTIDLLSAK